MFKFILIETFCRFNMSRAKNVIPDEKFIEVWNQHKITNTTKLPKNTRIRINEENKLILEMRCVSCNIYKLRTTEHFTANSVNNDLDRWFNRHTLNHYFHNSISHPCKECIARKYFESRRTHDSDQFWQARMKHYKKIHWSAAKDMFKNMIDITQNILFRIKMNTLSLLLILVLVLVSGYMYFGPTFTNIADCKMPGTIIPVYKSICIDLDAYTLWDFLECDTIPYRFNADVRKYEKTTKQGASFDPPQYFSKELLTRLRRIVPERFAQS